MFNMNVLKRKQKRKRKRGRGGRECTEIESRKKEQEERREDKEPERKIEDREKQKIEKLWEGEIEPVEKEKRKEKKKEGEIEMEIERGDMEKQLLDAAMRGDIESLHSIIDSDDYILDRVPMGDFKGKNPLHVAISTRREECVDLLLEKQPDLAEVLDPELGVALHIASAKGHLKIVELLLKVSPAMCLARDSRGHNPLHIAAMKDKIYVLEKLVKTNPFAARVKVDKGDTILHLCVNYKRLTSLDLLLRMISDQEFVNSVDTDGNNILHLAVLGGQFEIVQLVLYNTKIDVNARNKSGSTALDIHYIVTNREDKERVHIESNVLQDKVAAENIETLLREAGAKRRRELFLPYQPSWQKNKNETLMIVSSLVATMAFQVGLSPPGSVWQDNSGHEAGKSILAYRYPNWFPILMYVNTAGFLLSLSTILLLIMALPAEGKFFGAIRSFASWLTIMATAFVYTYCITVVTPNARLSSNYFIVYLVMTWACMISLYPLNHTSQSIRSLMEERVKQKNREKITWTIPQLPLPDKQLSIKVVGREDEVEAGLSTNVEAGASGSNEAGGSGSTSLIKREEKHKKAMEPNVEAGTSGSNEVGGGGSTSLIQPQRKQKEAMETLPGMIQPSPVSVEAGGSKKIEAGESVEVKVGESRSDKAGGSESNEDDESNIRFLRLRKRHPRPFPIEVGGSKKIEAGGSESDEVGRSKEIEVGGSKSDEAGISKEMEVAVSDEIEADRSGFDEAGITKEIEGGGSKEIEAVRSRSDEADIRKKIEAGRSESEEAGGSEEIEVSGSEEIEAGGSNKIEVCGSKEI